MNDRRLPKLRFKGFKDDWEQRKVSEIFKITRGYVLAATETADIKDDKNCYPVYSSQTKNEGLMGFYSEYLYENAITWTTDGANAGTVRYRSGKFYCTNVCGVLLSEEGYANKAVSEALNSVAWKYVSHVGNPKMMNNVMADIEIVIPKLVKEQETISRYFDEIDDLITLHQRKLEKLKIVKKAMLENCFPKNGEKVPEFRFSGFTGDWEQRKVGQLTNVLSASRVHKEEWAEDGVPFFRSSDVVSAFKGTENEKAFISVELYEQLAKSSGKLEKNDILITGGGSIGIPYIMPDNKPLYSKDADLIWIKHSANFDSIYLYTYFMSEEFREYLASISHTGTIAHYTIEQVKDTPVRLPSIDEQRKLGNFFVSLDHLITLHQRK